MSQGLLDASRVACGWNEAAGASDFRDGVGTVEEMSPVDVLGAQAMDIDEPPNRVVATPTHEGDDSERRWPPELKCVRCKSRNVDCIGLPGKRCNRCRRDKKGCKHSGVKKVKTAPIVDSRCSRCNDNNSTDCIGSSGNCCNRWKDDNENFSAEKALSPVEKTADKSPPLSSDVTPPRFHRPPRPAPLLSARPSDNANMLHGMVQNVCDALVDISDQLVAIEKLLNRCADPRCDQCVAKNFADCVGLPGDRCRRCKRNKKGCSKRVERVTRSTAPALSSDVRPPRFHRARAWHKPGNPQLAIRKFKAIRSTLRKFRATFVDVVDCIGNNTNMMSDMDLMGMVNHIVAWNDQIESSSS